MRPAPAPPARRARAASPARAPQVAQVASASHAFMLRVPPPPLLLFSLPHTLLYSLTGPPPYVPPRAPGALRARARRRRARPRAGVGVHDAPGRRRGEPPPPPCSYKVDTSRPSLRTNWTRLVQHDLLSRLPGAEPPVDGTAPPPSPTPPFPSRPVPSPLGPLFQARLGTPDVSRGRMPAPARLRPADRGSAGGVGGCRRRWRVSAGAPPPPLPSRTKWTRLVHLSVLTGHVSSLSPRCTRAWWSTRRWDLPRRRPSAPPGAPCRPWGGGVARRCALSKCPLCAEPL